MEQRLQPGQRRVQPLRVRRSADEERRLRLPAAHPRQSLKSTGKGGGHPAARRAVPRRRRGRHPPRDRPAAATSRASSACRPNLFYGTGIPACIVVLDKENAARPQGHLHDRRLARASSRTATRTACAPRTSTRSSTSSPARSRSRATRAWCRWPRSRPEERLQPQPAALHRQQRARGLAGHRRPPARRHSRPRHRRARPLLAGLPGVRAALFRTADRPGYSQLKVAARRDQGRHLRPCRVHRLQRSQ